MGQYSRDLEEQLWLSSSMELGEELTESASQFSAALRKMAVVIDANISAVIRKGVLDVFRSIIKRSPVLTGAYRASHGIANMEPAGDEDIVKGSKGAVISAEVALKKGARWTWKVGDGDIDMFNNLPYAEKLENGWSKQAPAGCYRVSLAELTQYLNQKLTKIQGLEPMGGE